MKDVNILFKTSVETMDGRACCGSRACICPQLGKTRMGGDGIIFSNIQLEKLRSKAALSAMVTIHAPVVQFPCSYILCSVFNDVPTNRTLYDHNIFFPRLAHIH